MEEEKEGGKGEDRKEKGVGKESGRMCKSLEGESRQQVAGLHTKWG